MIRIGSNADIGMNRNSSDWLGMNSYPILSPGIFCELRKLSYINELMYILVTWSDSTMTLKLKTYIINYNSEKIIYSNRRCK